MKVEVGPFIKTLGPATATSKVTILELSEGESFDERTLTAVTRWLCSELAPLFSIMEFDNHQTYRVVFNFVYGGETKSSVVFPVFTQNYRLG